jgi:hypothetical protein
MGEDDKKMASRIELVGLFELQWKVPHHDWLVEFFNTYQIKEETIYARLVENTISFDCRCGQNLQQRLKK